METPLDEARHGCDLRFALPEILRRQFTVFLLMFECVPEEYVSQLVEPPNVEKQKQGPAGPATR